MTRRRLGRRDAFAVGAFGLFGFVGLAACKHAKAFSCSGLVDLSVDEVEVRNRLAYTDRSPDAAKTCEGCQQFVAAPSDGQCGGCKIMKGPIHPEGYCKSFTRKG